MIRAILILLTLVPFAPGAVSAAETWAEKLGFPSGKRVLILYANHMGAAYEFNRPGQQLLQDRIIQSVGVMPACPWSDEFAKWCRENPGYDVGVCLSFNCPSDLYRWRPVSPRDQVRSLVDPDGYLWRTVLQFALRAELDDVKREVHAQIDKARKSGIRPTHLIPDMGSLLTRSDLTELYLDVAEEYWIPAVIPELTPAVIESFREQGFPLTPEMIGIINSYRLPKVDDLQFVPDTESYETKREAFYQLIGSLSPGITQIILHPADRTKALERVSPRWENRVWEAQLLADPAVHQFLEDAGVMMTNWIDIMARFDSDNESPARARRTKSGP